MKIVLPVLNFTRAGGARVLSQLASSWTRMGHEVIFCAHYGSAVPYYPTLAGIVWLDDRGRRVASNEEGKRHGGWASVVNLQGLLRGLNRHAADCDILLANHNRTAWPVAFCRSRAKKFYYVQAYEPEYCQNNPGLRGKMAKLTAEWSYRLPLKRIVNAPAYFDYQKLVADKFVPPGVDMEVFYPEPEPLEGEVFRLGCIGRDEEEKGTRYVLEAFELLLAQGRAVELRIAAFGALPEKYHAHPAVRIEVPLNDAELARFYRGLDMLAAPGIGQRGAPHYPVIEAMACSVAVVNTGYFPATEENSWLVPERNAGALAAAIGEMMTNPELVRKKKRQALCDVQQLAWDKVAQRMLEYFAA